MKIITKTKQNGLSLIELMIAVTLGIFITGAMIQLFVNTKQSYRVQENLSRLQENGRFAMNFITRDIRMAGYKGCMSKLVPESTLNDTGSYEYDFNVDLVGFNATGTDTWAPTLDSGITSPLSGSDVITIRGVFGQGIDITGQPSTMGDCNSVSSTTNSANIKVTNNSILKDNDIVVASSCEKSTIFQISQFNSGEVVVHNTAGSAVPGNATKDLGACFAGKGQLYKISSRTYYIRDNTAGVPSLYRKDGVDAAEELVEGIEAMQILYGEDTDNDQTPNYFLEAGSAGLDIDRVISVRISLLVRSLEDNLSTQAVPYTIFGVTTTPSAGDRRIRRVFTSTIAIRNRLP